MKLSLYLFNPENDMALACGDLYYMAPASARKMAADLSALPGWYAEDGAMVLLATQEQVAWMEAAACTEGTSALALPVSAVWVKGTDGYLAPVAVRWQCWGGVAPLTGGEAFGRICPWGWNPSLVRRLREAGVSEALLPNAARMQQIRTLSGRQTAVRVLQRLREREAAEAPCGSALRLGESFVLTSAAEVETFITAHAKALLKAPWSGSGRGVQYTQGEFTPPLQGWVRHILHTQQAVVGEPFYDKVLDFAMEFQTQENAPVRFAGYSLFETDARGIYKENWLASDAAIEERLAAYVPAADLHRLQQQLEAELTDALQGAYEGYLGVDMMICRDRATGAFALHPCVEINLRTNMGVVARRLYDRYVSPVSQGRYVIEFYPQPGEALRQHRALQEAYPLVVEGGRIRSGYCSLTPVLESTTYQAYMVLSE